MAKRKKPAQPPRGHVDRHLMALMVWRHCHDFYHDPAERRIAFDEITRPECPPDTKGVAAGIQARGYG